MFLIELEIVELRTYDRVEFTLTPHSVLCMLL